MAISKMGKVLSSLIRPVTNFNIESRAHKIISKEKPTPAPLHKASLAQSKLLLKEHPDSFQELLKKNEFLNDNLRNVYVKSEDVIIERNINNASDRPLPQNRRVVLEPEFGLQEPRIVAIGRSTLQQILRFITKHHEDPAVWNSTKIAIDYHLPEDTTKNILHYFRIYKLHIPEKKVKAIFAEPSVPKMRFKGLGNKYLRIKEGFKNKD